MRKLLLHFNANKRLVFRVLCASFAESFVYLTRGLPDGLISLELIRGKLGSRFWSTSLTHGRLRHLLGEGHEVTIHDSECCQILVQL